MHGQAHPPLPALPSGWLERRAHQDADSGRTSGAEGDETSGSRSEGSFALGSREVVRHADCASMVWRFVYP